VIDKRLSNIKKEYDVIIIGGGIYGATLLREAALKGLSAILLEKGDFGSATSANSLKIIHSGLRYLQKFDIRRIRESARELNFLVQMAPHLVQPIPCIIPTYRQLNRSKLALSFALKLYELISSSRLKNKKEPDLSGRIISRKELRNLIPVSRPAGITGGALWYDALNYNSERLVLTFILSALARGADAFNYLACQKLIVRNERAIGVKAYDQLQNQEVEVYSKFVVNTTGPWINQIDQHLYSPQDPTQFHFAKAVNLIIPRTLSDCAFGIKAAVPADDCSSRNRFLFFVPWRGATMIGTWYFGHHSTAEDIMLSENEFDRCLRQINQVSPDSCISGQEISFVHLGLVPVDLSSNKKDFKLKNHHCLIEHGRHGGPDRLLSVLGVKYTTARSVSAKTIDLISEKLNRKLNSHDVGNQPLAGGDIENIATFIEEKKENNTHKLTDETVQHLALNYGTTFKNIETLITDNPELGELIPGSDESIVAELSYCMKNEFVFHLSDLLLRRTGIGSLKKPKDETINFCANFMAQELGWTEPQKNKEISSLTRFYDRISSN